MPRNLNAPVLRLVAPFGSSGCFSTCGRARRFLGIRRPGPLETSLDHGPGQPIVDAIKGRCRGPCVETAVPALQGPFRPRAQKLRAWAVLQTLRIERLVQQLVVPCCTVDAPLYH